MLKYLKISKEFVQNVVVAFASGIKLKQNILIQILETILLFIAMNYLVGYYFLIIILILKQCILFLFIPEKMIWLGKNILQKCQLLKNYAIYYALPIIRIN